MPETNREWLQSLPNEEFVKYLSLDRICHEIMTESRKCPSCSCGDCIRMWLGRKRGKE